MVSDKDKKAIELMNKHLARAHKGSRSPVEITKGIARYFVENPEKYFLLYTKLACPIIRKSATWDDFSTRMLNIDSATSATGAAQAISRKYFGRLNKELKKTVCETAVMLIKKFGLPTDEASKGYVTGFTMVDLEEEKGFWPFKKMIPKTKDQIILELEVDAAS